MKVKDYYRILGVGKGVSDDEIKAAFRNLAKQHHPDVPGGGDVERFKEINEAYAVLSDPDKRAAYNRGPSPGQDVRGGTGWSAFGGPGIFDTFGSPPPFFASGGFTSFFRPGPPIVEAVMAMTLKEACEGARRQFEYEKLIFCHVCGGRGVRDNKVYPCLRCGGTGTVSLRECPNCGGEGHFRANPCPDCSGGWKKEPCKIEVQLPPGLRPRGVIRVAGAGSAGPNGEPGDLFLRVEYVPHSLFDPDPPHLRCAVPLFLPVAIFGGEVVVPLLRGGSILLKVPPGTKHGTMMRVPGHGLPSSPAPGAPPGDLLVVLEPEIPTPKPGALAGSLAPEDVVYTRVPEYQRKTEILLSEGRAGDASGGRE